MGYLKALSALVNETETSNLESLGRRLIDRVTQRVKLSPPFDEDLIDYARLRPDRQGLQVAAKDDPGEHIAGRGRTSGHLSGRRVAPRAPASWLRPKVRFPYLGTSLELVKKGTYSAMTRSLVLLAVTSCRIVGVWQFDRSHNPFRISDAQGNGSSSSSASSRMMRRCCCRCAGFRIRRWRLRRATGRRFAAGHTARCYCRTLPDGASPLKSEIAWRR